MAMMDRPRPPMMTAPDRGKPVMKHTPRIPVSLKAQAEAVVVQAAKEWAAKGQGGETDLALAEFHDAETRLADAVRVLVQLEGGE